MELYFPWLPKNSGQGQEVGGAGGMFEDLRSVLLQQWVSAPWQERAQMVPDDRLMRCAQDHAAWLATGARQPDTLHRDALGRMSNDRVRAYGYRLPDWYDAGINLVESIGVNWQVREKMVRMLHDSPYHHDHMTGKGWFFAEQTRVGVGYASDRAVFLSAPPEKG